MKNGSLSKILASNIKLRRAALVLSQESLSELMGVHRNTIALLEAGKRGVTLDMLEKLAKALKCEPYELLMHNSTSK